MSYTDTAAGRELHCDGEHGCKNPVTFICKKGWVLCDTHGERSKAVNRDCRKMRPYEINRLKRGEPIARY